MYVTYCLGLIKMGGNILQSHSYACLRIVRILFILAGFNRSRQMDTYHLEQGSHPALVLSLSIHQSQFLWLLSNGLKQIYQILVEYCVFFITEFQQIMLLYPRLSKLSLVLILDSLILSQYLLWLWHGRL